MAAFGLSFPPNNRRSIRQALNATTTSTPQVQKLAFSKNEPTNLSDLETPWVDSMSPLTYPDDHGSPSQPAPKDPNPPTYAAFSPTTISGSSLTSRQRSTIIVHRKSPLLVATPPPVTRALAYSHPFLLPLSRLAGLLAWTTGDPWESFLLVAGFWAFVLYGDVIVLWAGPIIVVLGLILGMYSRRYSPLSSSNVTAAEKRGHRREDSDGSVMHHKSLDEIVETLRVFTTNCNILLEPLLELTDFLSTQQTAVSATTKPALTALFGRILLVTPIWILLTLPPFRIITTRRVVLSLGTIILTWHSRPARVFRVIIWRSLTVRKICSMITGLPFSAVETGPTSAEGDDSKSSTRSPRKQQSRATDIATKKGRANSSGVCFTFILYENQRRWLGIGWTQTLFVYERAAWTDDLLNPAPSKDSFELPEVKGGNAKWRWVEGSEWRIEGASEDAKSNNGADGSKKANGKGNDGGGWIYYDNKWNDGRRGQDGWGRYTRRRKWYRDAELVEITPQSENEEYSNNAPTTDEKDTTKDSNDNDDTKSVTASSTPSKPKKKRWFNSVDVTEKSSSTPALSSSPPARNRSSTSLANVSTPTPGPSNSKSGRNGGSATGPTSGRRTSVDSGTHSGGRRSGYARSTGRTSGSGSLARSQREREIEEAEDHLDRWGTRPGGAVERAEREWGLGEDAHMGLS